MSRRKMIGYLAVLVVVLVAIGFMKDDDVARLDDLLAADHDFAAMSRAEGPGAAFALYLAADALQLPAAGEPVFGGETIAAAFADAPDFFLDWEPADGGVAASGDLGWTWGRYTASWTEDDGEPATSRGKYLNVWVRDAEGRWRVRVDMGNSEPEADPGE